MQMTDVVLFSTMGYPLPNVAFAFPANQTFTQTFVAAAPGYPTEFGMNMGASTFRALYSARLQFSAGGAPIFDRIFNACQQRDGDFVTPFDLTGLVAPLRAGESVTFSITPLGSVSCHMGPLLFDIPNVQKGYMANYHTPANARFYLRGGPQPRFPFSVDRNQMEDWLQRRAASDPTFRLSLLGNPEGTLQAALGKAVPKGVTVTVTEETAGTMCVVKRFGGVTLMSGMAHDCCGPVQLCCELNRIPPPTASLWNEMRSNPHAALARTYNLAVPQAVQVSVLEETPTAVHLVLYRMDHYAGWKLPVTR